MERGCQCFLSIGLSKIEFLRKIFISSYDPREKTKELYYLKSDPMESDNLALENKKFLRHMETILQKWNSNTKTKSSGTKYQKPDFTQEEIEQLKSLGYVT